MSRIDYTNGIARNFSQSAYPNLWRGLVGAFDAGVKMQGLGLQNFALKKRVATRATSAGGLTAANFRNGFVEFQDSTQDYLDIGSLAADDPLRTSGKPFSCVFKLHRFGTGVDEYIFSTTTGGAAAGGVNVGISGGAGGSNQTPQFGIGGTTLSASGQIFDTAGPHTCAMVADGTNWKIYFDGQLDTSSANSGLPPSNTSAARIGSLAWIAIPMAARFYWMYIYDRALTAREVMLFHQGASPLIKKNHSDEIGKSVAAAPAAGGGEAFLWF